MKYGLCVIGEVLIDFVPKEKNRKLKDVSGFERMAGGAPGNVAGAVSMLNGRSVVLSKVGKDAFGDFLIEAMKEKKIDVSYVKQSETLDTSLAFVSLDENGDRDFKFYRKTAADLDFGIEDLDDTCLDDMGIVHFGSVDLVPSKMKEAHAELLRRARERDILVSFDPNLRFTLWPDDKLLKSTVWDFMKYADIVKVSEEEAGFLCRDTDFVSDCFEQGCQVVICTKGKEGAELFTKDFHVSVPGISVEPVDTTGAGDAFIGAFLEQVLENGDMDLKHISKDKFQAFLEFANVYAAYMTTVKGALSSLTDLDGLMEFVENLGQE